MRTLNPSSIKSDFLSGLQDVEEAYVSMAGAALSTTNSNLMAEYTFLGASVLLEGFISDLFIAYINRDNSAFVNYLTGHMKIDASGLYAKRAKNIASIDITSHLSQDSIRNILDPNGYNVSFGSSDDLKEKAGIWLAQPYQGYIQAITPVNSAVFEAFKALRNFLAHRSASAKRNMQNVLTDHNLPQVLRRGQNRVHSVGYYLDSRPNYRDGHRLENYLAESRIIADVLCP
ncbi:hypothetical protein [Halomonas borealis]|uniref:hypothetical protein n=1 Tax=Halomonas borealis TaxID=2508710 RepID=UPI0010A02661|nr:hypothetical protein [Halomonas borealis]